MSVIHPPTLRQLSFFVALAETGSFREAAERSGVTQPALSAAIKELENLTGAVLFERGPRGATLTPAGESALDRARRILADAEDLVLSARESGEPMTGPLRLGVIPSIAPYLLPRALPELKTRFPELELRLKEDITTRLLDGLADRRLDLAIIALPFETPGLKTLAAFDDEFLLVAPCGHKLLDRKTLKPSDVPTGELLLLEDGHCLREHALAACKTPDAAKSREFGATSLQTLLEMVAAGYGVTLAPRLMMDAGAIAHDRVACRGFDAPLMGRQVGVVWRGGSVWDADAEALAATLRDILKPEAG
ncbi:MAG: LysR family transcriptional regulator [Euryhalocaulis sp.]|uniref:hydrogen peroxide-inducible genes activator n=1 Tax=Euryhalocaulis sp. TaxID=2744307 RepID=UPI0017D5593C|nr:hydrogen peroxide-inducible genes activator [Euryhalocaulis sp.]MBA4801773.1 LysR family transcriptional regulator [Euryhalocaulis sp.]